MFVVKKRTPSFTGGLDKKTGSFAKQAVINCALALLQEKGNNDWSYEDISKNADIKKAIIHYCLLPKL